jgi:hypothetical protein
VFENNNDAFAMLTHFFIPATGWRWDQLWSGWYWRRWWWWRGCRRFGAYHTLSVW